jgi:cleavage stimulation factor subunit 3
LGRLSCAGKGGYQQLEQVKLWKGFLDYERSNPQRLDATALTQRVELAYMQALMCLLHFPEVCMLLLVADCGV